MKHLFMLICLGLLTCAAPSNAQILVVKALGKVVKKTKIGKELNKKAGEAMNNLESSLGLRAPGASNGDGNGTLILTEDSLTQGVLHEGHYYVDLGLPVMWATCNVGANHPWETGEYFSWCETAPKESYSPENGTNYSHSNTEDVVKGNPQFDAASKNWGDKWRMPTMYEMTLLKVQCKWEPAKLNGQNGLLLTSKKNGNKIFIPAAYACGGDPSDKARDTKDFTSGGYWTATVQESSNESEAFALIFDINDSDKMDVDIEDYWLGMSVRAVLDKSSL